MLCLFALFRYKNSNDHTGPSQESPVTPSHWWVMAIWSCWVGKCHGKRRVVVQGMNQHRDRVSDLLILYGRGRHAAAVNPYAITGPLTGHPGEPSTPRKKKGVPHHRVLLSCSPFNPVPFRPHFEKYLEEMLSERIPHRCRKHWRMISLRSVILSSWGRASRRISERWHQVRRTSAKPRWERGRCYGLTSPEVRARECPETRYWTCAPAPAPWAHETAIPRGSRSHRRLGLCTSAESEFDGHQKFSGSLREHRKARHVDFKPSLILASSSISSLLLSSSRQH